MMSKHAALSPSSSERWINCPPSAKLNAAVPDKGSTYAKEGTDSHTLCAYKVERALGYRIRDPTEDLDYYDGQMEECAEEYCSFVLEQIEDAKGRCKDPLIRIEQRVDYSEHTGIDGCFGTADCLIAADGLLHIIDFKYGMGVEVSAEKNTQLSCYALGGISQYDFLYGIEDVKLTIFQPRLGNVSTYETTKDALLAWAEDTLRPAAALANEGRGEFKAGEHCRFCAVKATCRKRAEANLEMARYDFRPPPTLTEDEIADILSRSDAFLSWISDVKEHALQSALAGTTYRGYKLVNGRSARKYTDETAVAKAVKDAGFEPFERKILGVTAMSKMLGAKRFNELLGDHVYKPPGKPTLVPESDKRPAMNTAKDDFKD